MRINSASRESSCRRNAWRITLSSLVLFLAACGPSGDNGLADDSLAVGIPTATDTAMDAGDPMADTTDPTMDSENPSSGHIFDLLRDDSRFSAFAAILDSAGLGPTLSGPGPFTVFAPTNEAIAGAETDLYALLEAGDEDRLRDILLHHISNGETIASNLPSESIRSLSGEDLQVTGSGNSLSVDEARLLEPNIDASNGVIHAVDQVLDHDEADDLF